MRRNGRQINGLTQIFGVKVVVHFHVFFKSRFQGYVRSFFSIFFSVF